MRLLFVCTGNTCRSPMAAVVARAEAERREIAAEVRSAGTSAAGDMPASALAVEAVGARDLELSSHRSRQLSREDVEWADLVLGMNTSHVAAILATDPTVQVGLLSSFLPEKDPARDGPILDPIGGSREDYEETLDVLERAIAGLFDTLEARVAEGDDARDDPDGGSRS